jgi:hypothetical protein
MSLMRAFRWAVLIVLGAVATAAAENPVSLEDGYALITRPSSTGATWLRWPTRVTPRDSPIRSWT